MHAAGLVKRFGGRTVVDGVAFTVPRGVCFGFLGPNGAGKTSTMRMLCCLSPRDGGTLEVLGHDPAREPRPLKARLGVVAQEITLDLELSVRENLLVYAGYFGLGGADAAARAARLLDSVGLGDRAGDPVEKLSGGMKRRVQIARALVNDPDLVVLDEPTTGLDPHARQVVWERLRALKATGTTLVLTTHYMDEAEQLCDRLVIMDHGRIVAEGHPRQLIERHVGASVADAAQPGGMRRATLEDVFLRLTGRDLADADADADAGD